MITVQWRDPLYQLAQATRHAQGTPRVVAEEVLDALEKAGNEYDAALKVREAHNEAARRFDETRAERYRVAFEQCDALCRYVESIVLAHNQRADLLGPEFTLPFEPVPLHVTESSAQIGPIRFVSQEGAIADRTGVCVSLTPGGFVVELQRGRLLLRHEYASDPGGRGSWPLLGVTPKPLLAVDVRHSVGHPIAGTAMLSGGTGGCDAALQERVSRALEACSNPGSPLVPVMRSAVQRHHIEVELLQRAFAGVRESRCPPLGTSVPGLADQAINDLRDRIRRAEALTKALHSLPQNITKGN